MERGTRKTVEGKVISNKMDKTIIVRAERLVKHRLYEKYIRRWTKYVAHDEKNEANIGDKVEIVETRPLSKTKCWRLTKVVEKGSTV